MREGGMSGGGRGEIEKAQDSFEQTFQNIWMLFSQIDRLENRLSDKRKLDSQIDRLLDKRKKDRLLDNGWKDRWL